VPDPTAEELADRLDDLLAELVAAVPLAQRIHRRTQLEKALISIATTVTASGVDVLDGDRRTQVGALLDELEDESVVLTVTDADLAVLTRASNGVHDCRWLDPFAAYGPPSPGTRWPRRPFIGQSA
jgi:hypothetical protein